MDIKEIITLLKKQLLNLRNIIKEVWKLPYAKTYIFLSFVFTLFFIFINFPYDMLLRNYLSNMKTNMFKSIDVGAMDISLFGTSSIESLTININTKTSLDFSQVILDAELFPLARWSRIKGTLEVNKLNYTSSPENASGKLYINSDLTVNEKTKQPDYGSLTIELRNFAVDGLTIKGFTIPPVTFKSIKADATLKSKQLVFKNFSFTGKDLIGQITGSINLMPNIKNSRLNLKLEIDPNSAMYKNYEILLGSFSKSNNGRIVIPLEGTLDRPKAKLPKMSSPSEGKTMPAPPPPPEKKDPGKPIKNNASK